MARKLGNKYTTVEQMFPTVDGQLFSRNEAQSTVRLSDLAQCLSAAQGRDQHVSKSNCCREAYKGKGQE